MRRQFLVWGLSASGGGQLTSEKLTPESLERLWADLANADAGAAYRDTVYDDGWARNAGLLARAAA